jgi:hypothetical protein
MANAFVPGKAVRRRRKAGLKQDRNEQEFVAVLIACLNASRRANGERDVHPGAFAIIVSKTQAEMGAGHFFLNSYTVSPST